MDLFLKYWCKKYSSFALLILGCMNGKYNKSPIKNIDPNRRYIVSFKIKSLLFFL